MSKGRIKHFGTLLLIIAPPIIFFGLFFRYTINVPVNDDYRAILDNLNKTISTDSISEKISLFFSQHNEHRIVYDRIWTLLCYKINREVNFNYLSLIGNLSLFGIFFLWYQKAQQINKQLLLIIPISILIFNVSFYENMTFAMATMSNITIFLFSLLSIHFLTKEKLTNGYLFSAILFFFFAVFTQGGGLFLVPISLFILAYRKLRKQLIIFSITSLLVILLYFYGYESPSYHPSALSTLIDFKLRALWFSFAFLGNAFSFNLIYTNDINKSVVLTSVIGLLFFVAYLYLIKLKYYKKNLFIFSVLSLIILTSFITGVTRCQFGMETSGASRYRISSVLFLIGLYLAFVQNYNTSKKPFKYVLILLSFIYLFISIRQYEYLSIREKEVLTGVLKYHSGESNKLSGFEQEFYDTTIKESSELGTYYLPSFNSLQSYFPYSNEINIESEKATIGEINFNVQAIDKIKDGYLIDGWAYIENGIAANQEVYIGIKNVNQPNIKFLTVKKIPKFDLNPYFRKFTLQGAGFLARVKFADFGIGDNEIYIMVKKDDVMKLIKTDKKITI